MITDATSDIGRATAIAFGELGWRVALIAPQRAGLAAVRHEVEYAGGTVLALASNLVDRAKADATADRIEKALGLIDVWVNNAIATVFCPFKEISPADFDRAMRLGYLGARSGTLSALKHMRRRDQGIIIQVGSALGYRSIPLHQSHCCATSALRGFTELLRLQLSRDSSPVHITMVHLSPFTAPPPRRGETLGRMPAQSPSAQPTIAAEAIVWSALHYRREIWVGFAAANTMRATPRLWLA